MVPAMEHISMEVLTDLMCTILMENHLKVPSIIKVTVGKIVMEIPHKAKITTKVMAEKMVKETPNKAKNTIKAMVGKILTANLPRAQNIIKVLEDRMGTHPAMPPPQEEVSQDCRESQRPCQAVVGV